MDSNIDRISKLTGKAERKAKSSEFELAFILDEIVEHLKVVAPIKRRKWIEDQLMILYDQQNKLCAICGKRIEWGQFHVDHKIPFSKGGGNEFANLQLVHPFCNQSKNNGVRLSELLTYLEGRVLNIY